MKMWITIIILQILSTVYIGNGHGQDVNDWRPLTPRPYRERPVDIIVDVVNDLGTKVLDCYLERPGNVAFSPAGLAFVLAALYEGSAGRGNRQISHILGLPRDRRITRVGLRDVHRRLRSYLNADSFLGGLTLNRDDITLRPEYEDVLRFYGFDMANMTNGNNNTVMLNDTADTTTAATDPAMTTIINGDNSITTPLATTIDAATASDAIGITDTTIAAVITNPSAELISMIDTPSQVGNVIESTLSPIIASTPSVEIVETTIISEKNSSDDMLLVNSTVGEITNMNNTTDNSQERLIATTSDGNMNDTMQTTIPTIASVTTVNPSNQNTVTSVQSRDDNNVRKRRSIKERRSFPIYQDQPVWFDDLDGWQDYSSTFDDDIVGTPDQKMTQLNFLVNGCDISTISTTSYTAILPFAYFPALHALALEFPLDDPRYNVIIFIPTEGNDSKTLNRLLSTKTLRQLRESLRPTWVRASIPSFTLRGFITLTPYLQRLGIKDAFEPRTADLSPMSPDLGVYARDVQQSIGVNIRNFMKDMNDTLPTMSTTGNTYSSPGNIQHATKTPIPFIADRPFLFFIVDNETSVALIAGRIDDPLNSRIN